MDVCSSERPGDTVGGGLKDLHRLTHFRAEAVSNDYANCGPPQKGGALESIRICGTQRNASKLKSIPDDLNSDQSLLSEASCLRMKAQGPARGENREVGGVPC